MHCGSLAVQGKYDSKRWGMLGRRVGSLEHVVPLSRGGDNHFVNLGWSCLWCNHLDREKERKKGITAWGALDSGGFHPSLEGEPDEEASEIILAAKYKSATKRNWVDAKSAFMRGPVPIGFDTDDDCDFEMLPGEEFPEDTAMWRDTFGR
jgi:hypothetical protein